MRAASLREHSPMAARKSTCTSVWNIGTLVMECGSNGVTPHKRSFLLQSTGIMRLVIFAIADGTVCFVFLFFLCCCPPSENEVMPSLSSNVALGKPRSQRAGRKSASARALPSEMRQRPHKSESATEAAIAS